jgi:hypothetical protein
MALDYRTEIIEFNRSFAQNLISSMNNCKCDVCLEYLKRSSSLCFKQNCYDCFCTIDTVRNFDRFNWDYIFAHHQYTEEKQIKKLEKNLFLEDCMKTTLNDDVILPMKQRIKENRKKQIERKKQDKIKIEKIKD